MAEAEGSVGIFTTDRALVVRVGTGGRVRGRLGPVAAVAALERLNGGRVSLWLTGEATPRPRRQPATGWVG